MADTSAFALRHAGLNGFLFADIGEEPNGMTLSVLSALARQGADPWQEAGRLAGLPPDAAVAWLTRLIVNLPASSWSTPAATEIATRLVALLPDARARQDKPKTSAQSFLTVRQKMIALGAGAALLVGLVFATMSRPPSAPNGGVDTHWPADIQSSGSVSAPMGGTTTGR